MPPVGQAPVAPSQEQLNFIYDEALGVNPV